MRPLVSASKPFTRCVPDRTLSSELFGSGSRAFSFSVWNTAARSERRPDERSHLVPTSAVRLLSGGRLTVAAVSASDSADGLKEVP